MLIGRGHFRENRRWIVVVLLLAAAAGVWYFVEARRAHRLPGGTSLPGLVFGVLGGAIILFEFLLWPRKKVRAWRIGRAQTWMRAHIWLGLLTIPLIVLHTGFRFGGQLSTLLLVLYVGVIASGVAGLILQQWLPTMMLERVPAETIYSQIERVADFSYREAEMLVQATCGAARDTQGAESGLPEEEDVEESATFVVVGAVRNVGSVRGKVSQITVAQRIDNTQPLSEAFYHQIAPYLKRGGAASPLGNPRRAESLFQDMKMALPMAAHQVVDSLQQWCDERRQLDEQRRLYFWLHSWLWLHLPLSVALVLLMLVHAYMALKYGGLP